MQFLVGGRHASTVRARVDSEFAQLRRSHLEAIAGEAPQLIAALGDLVRRALRHEQLQRVLKEMLGELDDATLERIEGDLEWIELRSGEVVSRQGDPGDCMYIVVSGRLIGVREAAARRELAVEFGRGDTIGEMGFFTDAPRSLAIQARRASHLVRFTRPAFDRLSHGHPQAMLFITRLLIRRLQRTSGYVRESFERTNIVVLPISRSVDTVEFTERLVEALRAHAETLYVSSARLDGFLGVPGFAQTPASAPTAFSCSPIRPPVRTSARSSATFWARSPDSPPLAGRWSCCTRQRRVFPPARAPGSTPAVSKVITTCARGHDADFERVARFLTGNAIGVVLGGGGARGFAHIGVIRALREAGVPIDMIGGTSMGALIGAQPALGWDDATMLRINRESFVRSNPVSLRDYTLPVYSLMAGRRLERDLMSRYGEACIEDLWIGFFCVSSDLTRARAKIHRAGPIWKAVRASIALPGVFEPVVQDNRLLVDGAVLNNLPGDVMRQLGGGWVIAVDVSPERDLEVREERLPSPWRVLLG